MSEQDQLVIREQEDAVLVLRLNRPDVMNALSPDLEAQLQQALSDADTDPSVRAIVLTGEGRAFSAGYDMGRKREKPPTIEGVLDQIWDRDIGASQKLLNLMQMRTPVITAINGWCLGGGFWYALASDVTFAAESAVFAQPEVRHVSNTSFLFAALCGWKVAHRYGLTGDHFDAQEALRIGVVNAVYPDDELMARTMAYAHRVAMVPAASVRINKAVTNRGIQVAGMKAAMELNDVLSVVAHASTDAAELAELAALREAGDMRGFLKMRDGKFIPEPGGPRSATG